MEYFAKLEKQREGGFLVSFPDLDGCLTEGSTREDALRNAREALDGYLAAHCDSDLNIPEPKKYAGRNIYPVVVDIRIGFAIHLRRLRAKKGLTQSQIAKRLGISQQAYAKLETPDSNPSLDTIKRLSDAFGVEVHLKLVS